MVKINGLEVKNIIEFKDIYGYDIYQGDIYLNNKRIGFWSQSNEDFNDILYMSSNNYKLVEEIAYKYKNILPNSNLLKRNFDIYLIFIILCNYMEYEKLYRKYVTEDLNYMKIYSNGFDEYIFFANNKESYIETNSIKKVKQDLKMCEFGPTDYFELEFENLADFNIKI